MSRNVVDVPSSTHLHFVLSSLSLLLFRLLSFPVIRGLAIGKINNGNVRAYLRRELKMGATLSAILGVAGCLRAAIFLVPVAETIAITVSLCTIVIISILLGMLLPLVMKYVRIDPAHSSTTIQVLMDILGVTITCCKFALVFWQDRGSYLAATVLFFRD